MKKTPGRMWACRILLVLILMFIWGNSTLPAHLSGAVSDWVRDVLCCIFPVDEGNPDGGTQLLRKMAHFLEFACLGACLCWLFGMAAVQGKRTWICPMLFGFGAACIDESIQFFVPGRHASFLDVGIDSAGVLTGLNLVLLGYYVVYHLKRQRT